MKIFKIRNKETKLFSTGGRYAKWKEKGKIWDSQESAQKAINWLTRDEKGYHSVPFYKDAEIVGFDVKEI